MPERRIIELTQKVTPAVSLEKTVPFTHIEPSDRRFEVYRMFRVEPFHFGDDPQDISMDVTINADLGAHIELPYLNTDQFFGRHSPHGWEKNGPADVPAAQLIGSAAIIDLRDMKPGRLVSAADMEKAAGHVRPGDIAFCLSGHNERFDYNDWASWRECLRNQPGFTPEANEVLVAKGVKAFGFDHHSMEGSGSYLYDEETRPPEWAGAAHRVIFYSNVALFENLTNLSQVKGDRTFVLALPMRLDGVSGVTARVIALNPDGTIADLSPAFRPFPGPDIVWPSRAFERREPAEFRGHLRTRVLVDGFWLQPVPPLSDKTPVSPDYGDAMTFNTRIGTHMVAPYHHLVNEGLPRDRVRDVARIPLERCVGDAVLVDLPHVGPRQLITVQDLEASEVRIKADDIVLVRTGYSDRYGSASQYHEYSPGFSIEALRWLAGKRIKLLGTDTASLVRAEDRFRTINEPYVTLFTANAYVVESLQNLGQLGQERVFFAALPVLRGFGLDASPVRAVAIEHFHWS